MRKLVHIFFLVLPILMFSQSNSRGLTTKRKLNSKSTGENKADATKVASIDMYRIISLERDTTYLDTSLTIQREYSMNFLRKDIFGLMPFSNEGQPYNTLQYSLTEFNPFPEFGFKAKHFSFLEANQIKYSSVATPVTELYFKSIMGRGQSVDSFFTLNFSPNFNISVSYRGLRSEGKYINQLTSTGNFKFTTSYNTKNKRYYANAHFTSQDILNFENGGITNSDDFEGEDPKFTNRQRLQVYLTDAESFLKGKRIFLDHLFRLNSNKTANNLYVTHQINYENKFFEYNQPTIASLVGTQSVFRFGNSVVASNLKDQSHYNKMYNKVGVMYENTSLGQFRFFVDDYQSNYYYNKIYIKENEIIPSTLTRQINSAGGEYRYQKNSWNGKFLYSRSITNQSLSNLDAKLNYNMNDDYQFLFRYQNLNKLPNDNYNLYQSGYVDYNWSNNFKNEKINTLSIDAVTPWIETSFQITTLDDHLYFENIATDESQQIVNPKQYGNTINYLSLKVNKEISFGKLALDNTILYQKADQKDPIINVPEIVTRNTLYYSGHFFKKALFVQTGITLNYFTNYFANDYNPVIGEFFVQNKKEIGNFPMLDLFFNAKIQRTRIYFKAEHFNSSFSGNNFYSAPNYPYRDFTIRFGLIWNFFN